MRKKQRLQALAVIAALACFAGACLAGAPAQAQDDPLQMPEAADPGASGPAAPEAQPPAFEARPPAFEAQPPAFEAQPGGPKAQPAVPRKSVKRQPARPPQSREAMLAELYAHLATAPDAEQAASISKTIEGLWVHSGSDTTGVLVARASKALNDQRPELALKLLDAVVELSPDFADGWSRRAYVYYLQSDFEHAVGDLRRALALEPNHYKALEGLARILRESGQKKNALSAYQQLLRINPYMPGAKEAADELSLEVEGQGI
jgi:tetratricopeptide (TPR) repeat protein